MESRAKAGIRIHQRRHFQRVWSLPQEATRGLRRGQFHIWKLARMFRPFVQSSGERPSCKCPLSVGLVRRGRDQCQHRSV
jgi:hypothetical protein